MNIALIKRMMDACYQAKRVRDLLPALPDGVLPSFIQYLDAIQTLEQQGVQVKVTYLTITEAGWALSRKYDAEYFSSLVPALEVIPEEDAETMIRTIEIFYQIMVERRDSHEK